MQKFYRISYDFTVVPCVLIIKSMSMSMSYDLWFSRREYLILKMCVRATNNNLAVEITICLGVCVNKMCDGRVYKVQKPKWYEACSWAHRK